MKKAIVAIMAIGLVFGLSGVAQAKAYWSRLPEDGPGDWNVGANWGGSVPGLGSTYIQNGGTAQIYVTPPTINTLLMNGGSTVQHFGGTLTVAAFFYGVGYGGTPATYELSGGIVDVNGGGIPIATGTFRQTGGTVDLSGNLSLTSGLYEVSGGTGTITVGGAMSVNALSTVALKPDGASLTPFNVGTTVTLTSGCELDVEFLADPFVDDTLTVINKTSVGAISGTFTEAGTANVLSEMETFWVDGPSGPGTIELEITYEGNDLGGGDNNVELRVLSAGAPIPEPAGLGLMGLAMLALRRRRG